MGNTPVCRHCGGTPGDALEHRMDPVEIGNSARNVLSTVEIKLNRLLGREFIPRYASTLHIETSSVCNLECCFCAYVKKQSPKVSMTNAFFVDVVRQAVELGYRRFEMTPCTGDVFMDPNIFEKFEHLEAHADVAGYQFFTNFTVPRPKDIERLLALKKLTHVTISIYGHDPATFEGITGASEKIYKRLCANLEQLFGALGRKSFDLDFGMRSTKDMPRRAVSELMRLMERFEAAGVAVRRSHGVYNNWGGYVTAADQRGLPIDINGAERIYKNGACAHLFTTVQVMATGIVNGCACRDVDATLRIGDLNATPLREIISPANPAYMQLIDEQQRGEFRPVCKSCDFYKSIYHMRSIYRKSNIPLETLDGFKTRLARERGVTPATEPSGS
jgi:uncharacterized Fe-S cluster-containing radical SAM superfamily protein